MSQQPPDHDPDEVFVRSLEIAYSKKPIIKEKASVEVVSDDEELKSQKLQAAEDEVRKQNIDKYKSRFKPIGSKHVEKEVIYVRGSDGQIRKLVKRKTVSQSEKSDAVPVVDKGYEKMVKSTDKEFVTATATATATASPIQSKKQNSSYRVTESEPVTSMAKINSGSDTSATLASQPPTMFSDSDDDEYDPFSGHPKSKQNSKATTKQLLKGLVKDPEPEQTSALANQGLAMAMKLARQTVHEVTRESKYEDYEIENYMEEDDDEEPIAKKRKKKN
jgi:hypothetical protein